MRILRGGLALGLLVATTASVALAMPARGTITAAGASLRVPPGWHAVVSETPTCDPERLIAASSAPLSVGPTGAIAGPGKGQVVVLLVEDRLPVDRPGGDLRRPGHFSVTWSRLTRTKPARFCGDPGRPLFMRYFRVRGRYLGFLVYPGAWIGRQVRAKTLAVMDSLRVAG